MASVLLAKRGRVTYPVIRKPFSVAIFPASHYRYTVRSTDTELLVTVWLSAHEQGEIKFSRADNNHYYNVDGMRCTVTNMAPHIPMGLLDCPTPHICTLFSPTVEAADRPHILVTEAEAVSTGADINRRIGLADAAKGRLGYAAVTPWAVVLQHTFERWLCPNIKSFHLTLKSCGVYVPVRFLERAVCPPMDQVISGYVPRGTNPPITLPTSHPHTLRLRTLNPVITPIPPPETEQSTVTAAPLPTDAPAYFLPACPAAGLLNEDELYLMDLRKSNVTPRARVVAAVIAATPGGGKAPKGKSAKKGRAHHDLGFFPIGVGGARVMQVMIRPNGFLDVAASVKKSEAAEFILKEVRIGSLKDVEEMLTDNGGEFGGAYREALLKLGINPLNSAP